VTTRAGRQEPRPLLSIPALAELVGVNPSTLYRAINRGEFPLPIVKLGNRLQVPRAAVERLIQGDRARETPAGTDGDERSQLYCSSCGARLACSPAGSPPPPSSGRVLEQSTDVISSTLVLRGDRVGVMAGHLDGRPSEPGLLLPLGDHRVESGGLEVPQ
jgi:excisionase family DNA binding protein